MFVLSEYAKLGVRLTPAVIVYGKIVSSGKMLTVEELTVLLKPLRRQDILIEEVCQRGRTGVRRSQSEEQNQPHGKGTKS
jgi:hypothetical protein